MFIRDSANPFWAQSYITELLDELNQAVPAVTALNGGSIALFKAGLQPTPLTTLAEFVAAECDFTDYTRKTNSLVGPANMGLYCKGLEVSLNFLMSTDPVVTTNDVGGWFFVAAGNTKLVAACLWDQLVPMANVGDKLSAIIRFPFRMFQAPAEPTV